MLTLGADEFSSLVDLQQNSLSFRAVRSRVSGENVSRNLLLTNLFSCEALSSGSLRICSAENAGGCAHKTRQHGQADSRRLIAESC